VIDPTRGQDTPALVHPVDAAFDDLERRAVAERWRVAFWEALGRFGAIYGVEVVLPRTLKPARWDERYAPPLLLEATVRFRRPGYARPKRRRA
jgi:hypothetical protein